jgi:phosphohistidine phosphatase
VTTRCFLVRHATAEPPARDDAGRRLTPEGRARFAALASGSRAELSLSRIHASPFRRAVETAALLAEVTGAPVLQDEALAPGATSGRGLLALALRLGAGSALVGHNPEIAEAIEIAAGARAEVRPGTIAALEADGARWRLLWIRAP